MKPVKAKDKRIVVRGNVYERSSSAGYTRSEARGVFGSCYEYSAREQERIDDYLARKSGSMLDFYKKKHADVPERMRERQEAAMRKVMEMRNPS